MDTNSIQSRSAVTLENMSLGDNPSLQLLFAKFQLALAEAAKKGALDNMDQIQKSHDEQKRVSALLQQARQLQSDAKAGNKSTSMPQEMKDYMDANNLAYDKSGNDMLHNKDEWDVTIKSLEAKQDDLGIGTQQTMVFIQDFMGQYNSYLQGASRQVSESSQTLLSLLRP